MTYTSVNTNNHKNSTSFRNSTSHISRQFCIIQFWTGTLHYRFNVRFVNIIVNFIHSFKFEVQQVMPRPRSVSWGGLGDAPNFAQLLHGRAWELCPLFLFKCATVGALHAAVRLLWCYRLRSSCTCGRFDKTGPIHCPTAHWLSLAPVYIQHSFVESYLRLPPAPTLLSLN